MPEQENMRYAESGCPDTSEQDIETLIALLNGRTGAGDSRIRVDVVEGEGQIIARQYHHGRCDVGSPWACGASFDLLE